MPSSSHSPSAECPHPEQGKQFATENGHPISEEPLTHAQMSLRLARAALTRSLKTYLEPPTIQRDPKTNKVLCSRYTVDLSERDTLARCQADDDLRRLCLSLSAKLDKLQAKMWESGVSCTISETNTKFDHNELSTVIMSRHWNATDLAHVRRYLECRYKCATFWKLEILVQDSWNGEGAGRPRLQGFLYATFELTYRHTSLESAIPVLCRASITKQEALALRAAEDEAKAAAYDKEVYGDILEDKVADESPSQEALLSSAPRSSSLLAQSRDFLSRCRITPGRGATKSCFKSPTPHF